MFPRHGHFLLDLFVEKASSKQFLLLISASVPLLAEAIATCALWSRYRLLLLRRRSSRQPWQAATENSLSRIFFINVFLTVLLVGVTVTEAVIVSVSPILYDRGQQHAELQTFLHGRRQQHAQLLTLSPTASQSLQMQAYQTGSPLLAMRDMDDPWYLRAAPMVVTVLVWAVVVAYTGTVAYAAMAMARNLNHVEVGKGSKWSMPSLCRIMQVVDRSAWLSLCLAVFISMLGFYHQPPSVYWLSLQRNTYMKDQFTVLKLQLFLRTLFTTIACSWMTASSTLILLHAMVSLYAVTGRVTLFIACKRISLQGLEDEEASIAPPLIGNIV